MPFRQLVQRWLLVVASALVLAVAAGWLLNAALTEVWFHRSTLLILALVLGLWGVLMRRWLQPLARRQASVLLARSPVARQRSRGWSLAAAATAVVAGGLPPLTAGGGAAAGLPGGAAAPGGVCGGGERPSAR